MLRKREKAVIKDPQQIDTLIGAHSVITGELSFEGSVRIDGRFNGNIHADKEGTLIVSEGAMIQGEVHVPSLILHGMIEGNVHTSESLKLGSTGQLKGDVEYKVLSLAEGSAINGRCNRIQESAKQAVTKNNKQANHQASKKQQLQEV